jgi:hypothetical protein
VKLCRARKQRLHRIAAGEREDDLLPGTGVVNLVQQQRLVETDQKNSLLSTHPLADGRKPEECGRQPDETDVEVISDVVRRHHRRRMMSFVKQRLMAKISRKTRGRREKKRKHGKLTDGHHSASVSRLE